MMSMHKCVAWTIDYFVLHETPKHRLVQGFRTKKATTQQSSANQGEPERFGRRFQERNEVFNPDLQTLIHEPSRRLIFLRGKPVDTRDNMLHTPITGYTKGAVEAAVSRILSALPWGGNASNSNTAFTRSDVFACVEFSSRAMLNYLLTCCRQEAPQPLPK